MAVYYDVNNLPAFTNPVLTIGSFDGVHFGHKAILSKVVARAREAKGESVLITFEPHPRKIIHPDQPLGLLSSLDQKIEWLLAEGIDHIVVVPFTRDFSMLSALQYIRDFLQAKFHPHTLVIGYDHHFGHSREGNIDLLRAELEPEVNIYEIPAQLIEDAAVSSTKVRKAIVQGKVAVATEMLSRPFSFSGLVVHGNKLGRTLGFPTANLQVVDQDVLMPGKGIYAVEVAHKGTMFKGMMSIGYRPTVTSEQTLTCEVNILDFSGDIYGQILTVYCHKYLRDELKFDTVAELVQQIKEDEAQTRSFFDQQMTK